MGSPVSCVVVMGLEWVFERFWVAFNPFIAPEKDIGCVSGRWRIGVQMIRMYVLLGKLCRMMGCYIHLHALELLCETYEGESDVELSMFGPQWPFQIGEVEGFYRRECGQLSMHARHHACSAQYF